MHVNANGRGQQDYKMFVVGHRAVGKSALVVRFLTNRFISEYQENSEMTCNGTVEVDAEKMQLRIQDTSEKGIKLPAIDHYFRAADAIMLVYSITDKISFQQLRDTTDRLKLKLSEHEYSDERIPAMIIVGNKGDLEHCREVKTDDGLALADKLGCHFYETSAREGWSKQFTRNRTSSVGARTDSLYAAEKPATVRRRKSDPALILNSIFDLKKSPPAENDMNNNASKKFTTLPTGVPQISISPSEETHRAPSRGRRIMQKLSPRFPRKFGASKPQGGHKTKNLSAGLATMVAPGLAVGTVGSNKYTRPQTLTTTPFNSSISQEITVKNISTHSVKHRTHTLRVENSWSSSLSDASSSSSSESLVLPNDNDLRQALFFRAETPVSDTNASSSDDENFATISKSARAAAISRHHRRSRSQNRVVQHNATLCNTDNDLKPKIHTAHHVRGRSESRLVVPANLLIIPDSGYRERKFNVSEPFKHLCREARSAHRMRDRLTPTRIFRDGIRKIKTSLASDQHHNSNFRNTQFQVTAVGR